MLLNVEIYLNYSINNIIFFKLIYIIIIMQVLSDYKKFIRKNIHILNLYKKLFIYNHINLQLFYINQSFI